MKSSFLVRAAVSTLALGVLAPSARGQNLVLRADSLLKSGQVFSAETLYYAAVRRQPRDPAARLALGNYLAARGALKVGAVLMEEARFFGSDAKAVAIQLAPVYARLGDYRALASLPGSELPYGERARAAWLQSNPPSVQGPDSTTIPYTPGGAVGLGRVTLMVDGDSIDASIDPSALGLVLDTVWAMRPGLKTFKAATETDSRRVAGAAATVKLGPMTLASVPVQFSAIGNARVARIGLDVLGMLAPTFDPASRRLTLRKSGKIGENTGGTRIPTLVYGSGLWIVRDGAWSVTGERGRALIPGRWTLNARRGEIILN